MIDQRPLILFTNDDGVRSPGLLAVASAFSDVADILIVAPQEQQSGMGRSLPMSSTGEVFEHKLIINGAEHIAYGVSGTPAQAVQYGVFEVADRRPAMIVSGINYGENCGNGVTISGTVGAALEAAALGIRAIAVSQQTPKDLHLTHSPDVDFSVAAQVARRFGLWLLDHLHIHEQDVDLLKIDLPMGVTPDTPWQMTRLSRSRVYWPARSHKRKTGPLGYYAGDTSRAERGTDVYAVFEDKQISVTPISLDMTSRLDLRDFRQKIEAYTFAAQ